MFWSRGVILRMFSWGGGAGGSGGERGGRVATLTLKPLPYFRPKSVIVHTLLRTTKTPYPISDLLNEYTAVIYDRGSFA